MSCLFFRAFSTRIHRIALVHSVHGNPEDVVSLCNIDIGSIGSSDVLIKILKAPVNPVDINKIQGSYPEKISTCIPNVCGNEGVGSVVEVGSSVQDLKPGDLVIPALPGLGTWQTYGVYPETAWMKVVNTLPLKMAASLLVNPFTAYRMLEDFVPLKDGDVVVQNSANSAVGQAVIQLASMRNIKTINVIRNRPHFEKVSNYLMELGGSIVISEEQAITHKAAADIISEYGMPSLALNGVGGKSVNTLLRYLSENGTLVTYGGMSRKPITIPTGSLIFKGYTFVGYWNSRWLKSNLRSEKHLSMIQELSNLAMSGNLKPPPFVEYKLSDYKAVLQRALQPYSDTKMMFSLL